MARVLSPTKMMYGNVNRSCGCVWIANVNPNTDPKLTLTVDLEPINRTVINRTVN